MSGIKEIFPFSMNVDCDQRAVAQKFFTPTRAETDAINGEPFQEGKTSAPVLRNFSAYVECRVRRIIKAEGDHAIVLMEVLEAECRAPIRPLTIRESHGSTGGKVGSVSGRLLPVDPSVAGLMESRGVTFRK